jgi:uncharacterized cupredoxin-like copper-binding protein
MKKILLTLVATMMLCLGASAQQYVMKITKADGNTVEINADDIKDVTFVQTGTTPIVLGPHHFDLTVTVGKQGGMGRDVTTIVQSRDRLDTGATVDFKNVGAEINTDYTMETIIRGKYYYQVPNSEDRFVKLQFKDNKMQVVQAQPFKENTYNKRQYTHAWTADNQLIIMAANGDKNAIVWTKLNTDDMTIVSEGTLSINVADGWESFTTSGILAYRENDNKLFYFYYNKKGTGRKATKEEKFHVAVINAETMAVEQDNQCPFAAEMAGSAYGELLQQTTFFDEAGNLYIAAFSDTSIGEEGKLLRIKKGEFNIDADFNGFPNSDGKLLTTQYLGNGKLFCYSRHDDEALGTAIDSYAHYYSVVDMNAGTRTRMSFGGTEIPYSSGRFSQRSAFDPNENKVYFGVNTETAQPQIYVYDVKTGDVSEGIKVSEGYYFEQIRIVED